MGCMQSAEQREVAEKNRFLKEQVKLKFRLKNCLFALQFRFYMNGVCFDSSNLHGVDIVSCSLHYDLGSSYMQLGASQNENAFSLTQALINGAENLPLHFSSLYLSLGAMQTKLADGVNKNITNPKASTKNAHNYVLKQNLQIIKHMRKLITALDGDHRQFTYIRHYVQVCNHVAYGLSMKPDWRVFVVPETMTVPYVYNSYVKTYHHMLEFPAACASFTALSAVLDKMHRYLGVGAVEFSKHSPKYVEDRVIVFSFIRNLNENLYFGVDEMREAKMTRLLIDRARSSLTRRERVYYTNRAKILPMTFSTFYQSVGRIQIILNDCQTNMIQERRRLAAARAQGRKVVDGENENALKASYMNKMWQLLDSALRTLNDDLNGLLAEGEEKLKAELQGYLEVFHEIEIVAGIAAV